MEYSPRQVLVTLLLGAAAVTSVYATGDEDAGDPGSRQTPTSSIPAAGWNATVAGVQRMKDDPWTVSTMKFRIYDDAAIGRHSPRRRISGYAVDVNARFEKCLDGTIEVSELDVGGLLYQTPSLCAQSRWQSTQIGETFGREHRTGPPELLLDEHRQREADETETGPCDPATWSCRLTGRQD